MFNEQEYWGAREYKVWVVYLTQYVKNRIIKSETRYVRSKTKSGAIVTGKYNSFLTGKICATARLATPTDLGCVENG